MMFAGSVTIYVLLCVEVRKCGLRNDNVLYGAHPTNVYGTLASNTDY